LQQLVFGRDNTIIESGRAATSQTPGGTGALRVAADFIQNHLPKATIWISNPSWANHRQIFESAGLTVKSYRYYDSDNKSLDIDGLIDDLHMIPKEDVVLFHACCHNPTGVDPSFDQWQSILEVTQQKGFLPLFDMAYQGFAQGLDEDAAAVRLFAENIPEMLLASSFSKNFGLYNERIGALTLLAETSDAAKTAFSQIKICIRTNFSNPPAHGGLLVSTILENDKLTQSWQDELTAMRKHINQTRKTFTNALTKAIPGKDFSFIEQQNGMFSFSGLNKDQVKRLIEEFGIYIVGSGRINVAGITSSNLDYIVNAIAKVSD
ncbi:MAG: aspartate/tyrosine/aromatic aminotransferase, partial [Cellvibrionales bacterium]|nr:aspartate/tyrosine/aromatic aminotransferase [Cellvibrionales bacterium]